MTQKPRAQCSVQTPRQILPQASFCNSLLHAGAVFKIITESQTRIINQDFLKADGTFQTGRNTAKGMRCLHSLDTNRQKDKGNP